MYILKCQGITWNQFFEDTTAKDKVLLINPPVKELRYAWFKWNQPLDLMKLSSFLKQSIGCQVELFDFMLPGASGRPRMTSTSADLRTYKGNEFQFRLYGRSIIDFEQLLDDEIKRWEPTKILVTSLTSYWWEGINLINSSIKSIYQNADIYVIGNYSKYEPKHVKYVFSDYYLTDHFNFSDYNPDLDLYFSQLGKIMNNERPQFASITINSKDIESQIVEAYNHQIKDFVFFEDDILDNIERFEDVLSQILKVKEKHSEIKFHGICGFYPSKFKPGLLSVMKKIGFTEVHLEYDCFENGELNVEAYHAINEFLNEEKVNFPSGYLTGFVNFGCKGENFEKVIFHSLQILDLLGSFIPKPFTATPGTEDYKLIREKLKAKELQFLSPHAFPFTEENGLEVEDYRNYLRLSSFLNNKVRGKAFDYFDNSVVSKAIREAFRKGGW